jgi:hypothetical protein
MGIAQGEFRLVVIESNSRPVGRLVAAAAVRAELAPMWVVGPVAIDTSRRCFAVLLPGLVAGAAVGRRVSASQREVGTRVVKDQSVELHDVGLAAEVFRVARIALRRVDSRQASVEPAVIADVRADFLVAGHAERGLPIAIRAVVALRAFLLELRVGARDLARHDQGLEACAERLPGGHARSHQDNHGDE